MQSSVALKSSVSSTVARCLQCWISLGNSIQLKTILQQKAEEKEKFPLLLPTIKITSLLGTGSQMVGNSYAESSIVLKNFKKACIDQRHGTRIHQATSVLREAHICLWKLKLDKTECTGSDRLQGTPICKSSYWDPNRCNINTDRSSSVLRSNVLFLPL